jgi:hypothetical protein
MICLVAICCIFFGYLYATSFENFILFFSSFLWRATDEDGDGEEEEVVLYYFMLGFTVEKNLCFLLADLFFCELRCLMFLIFLNQLLYWVK